MIPPMGADLSVTRTIAAPPQVVWHLVSDLPRMGEWSPEATGGRWKDGTSRACKGARFAGRNRSGWRRWSTLSTVTGCDPGSAFEFEVTSGPVKVARWRYDIVATDEGCTVTESWEDRRPGWFATATSLITGVSDRRAHTEWNINTTLDALARAAETAVGAD